MTKRKSPKDKGAKDKGGTAGREWWLDDVRAGERASDGAAGVADAMCAMCAAGAVAWVKEVMFFIGWRQFLEFGNLRFGIWDFFGGWPFGVWSFFTM
jgi:hypothetical protein